MTSKHNIQKEIDREMARASLHAIREYQRFLTVLRYGEGHPDTSDEGHFGFIPSEPGPILTALIKAKHLLRENDLSTYSRGYPTYKFLDAGCGVGNIMLLANCIGFDAWGIERDPETIKLACKLDCHGGEHIIKSDMVEYKDYGKYDVIYYYQPMRSEKMKVFVDALHSQIKVGAIVIPNGDCCQFAEDSKFEEHYNNGRLMYRKTVK